MGLSLLFAALAIYSISVLVYMSDLYNLYIYDKLSGDSPDTVLEFDYIIGESQRTPLITDY